MSGDDLRGIQDPLFARVSRPEKRQEKGRSAPEAQAAPSAGAPWLKILVGAGLVAVLAAIGFYLYQAQTRIESLSADLIQSQSKLETVTDELVSSRETIGDLQEGLQQSSERLKQQNAQLGQAKVQVESLKSETSTLKEEQQQQSRELQAINLQKADKSQVESLEGETQQIRSQVGEAQSKISELGETSSKLRVAVDSNSADITRVSSRADGTARDLTSFKESLDRDTFNFELQKKGATMNVVDVLLNLKGTNFRKQQYEMEITVGGRRIKKKNVNVNEPIIFYLEGGNAKHYEVVVTKVGKDFVVGHLSVPKKPSADRSISG